MDMHANIFIYCLFTAALCSKFMVEPLFQQCFQDPALVSRTAKMTLANSMQRVSPQPLHCSTWGELFLWCAHSSQLLPSLLLVFRILQNQLGNVL